MSARKKLVFTAARLFHAKGYNNTSVQDILEKSAVFRNNFYYHFQSKEQLGFEVLERRMSQWYEFVLNPSLDDRKLSARERINALLDRVSLLGCSKEGEFGCPFGNLALEMSCIHEPFRQKLSDFFRSISRRLTQCLEEGMKSGDFPQNLPSDEIADFAIALIQGSFLLRKTHRDPEIFQKNIEMLRRLFGEDKDHA
ncbi:MAG: TetR/AcrR family transcriptional regulator [Candidatus Abyssobacteria bacterium SURF_5]|uniref:TetR/AcrR family transcriptional regulator n=1 Tax=Abyssobacteria bacterium (strain SURF_5) TaxID=2093360 RepID=A0A3A4NAF5_ABYX5|nr:MAG: TetR/AcrR family transcriptional regulator [Candidatus Abyssubacteria bacterium SURF_5]